MRMMLQMQQMGLLPPPGAGLPALGGAPGTGAAAPGVDFSALLGGMGQSALVDSIVWIDPPARSQPPRLQPHNHMTTTTTGAGANNAAGTVVPPLPGAAPVPVADPATRYAAQLQQLQDMGFSDRERNLQVGFWGVMGGMWGVWSVLGWSL